MSKYADDTWIFLKSPSEPREPPPQDQFGDQREKKLIRKVDPNFRPASRASLGRHMAKRTQSNNTEPA
jgi:hypothetical protein